MASYGKDIRMGDSLISDYHSTKLVKIKTKTRLDEIIKVLKTSVPWIKEVKVYHHVDIRGQYRIELIGDVCRNDSGQTTIGMNLRVTTLKPENPDTYPSITWEEIKQKD